jgi:hypothetical protein
MLPRYNPVVVEVDSTEVRADTVSVEVDSTEVRTDTISVEVDSTEVRADTAVDMVLQHTAFPWGNMLGTELVEHA